MSKNPAAVLLPSGNNTRPFNTCTSAGFRTGHLSRAAGRGAVIDLLPVPAINHQPSAKNQLNFSFPCAQPRTSALPPSTSLCMVCMIRTEEGSKHKIVCPCSSCRRKTQHPPSQALRALRALRSLRLNLLPPSARWGERTREPSGLNPRLRNFFNREPRNTRKGNPCSRIPRVGRRTPCALSGDLQDPGRARRASPIPDSAFRIPYSVFRTLPPPFPVRVFRVFRGGRHFLFSPLGFETTFPRPS
jgi:hypothetical protein